MKVDDLKAILRLPGSHRRDRKKLIHGSFEYKVAKHQQAYNSKIVEALIDSADICSSDKVMLTMKYLEFHTYKELALKFGITVSNAKKRVSRAILNLLKGITDNG